MNDTELLGSIRNLYETVDPPPPSIARSAIDYFDLHYVDAIVARLVYDSAEGLVGVRSTTTTREMSYVAGDITLDLMAEQRADGIMLVGQISPAAEVTVTIVQGNAIRRTRTDSFGRFNLVGLDRDSLRLSTDHGLVVADITLTGGP